MKKNGFFVVSEDVMKFFAKKCGIIAIVVLILVGMVGCNTLESITIKQPPAQLLYGQGQAINADGLIVGAVYKKDGEIDVRYPSLPEKTKITFSQNYFDNPGKQVVTVTMQAPHSDPRTAVFEVTVIPVENISIVSPPSTTSFRQGANPDWSGLKILVEYEGKAVPDVTLDYNSLDINGFNKDASGTQTVTVNYFNKHVTFDVKIAGITSISVESPPAKTEYYIGEPFDPAGIQVRAVWDDGQTAMLGSSQLQFSNPDVTLGSQQTVTVTYSGKAANFSVTYIRLSAIRIANAPSKTEYKLGDNLETYGLSVMGSYPGHDSIQIPGNRLKVTGYDKNMPGMQTITVSVGGAETSFMVKMINQFAGTWTGTYMGKVAGAENIPITLIIAEDSNGWIVRTMDNENKSAMELFGTYAVTDDTHIKITCNSNSNFGGNAWLRVGATTELNYRCNYFSGASGASLTRVR
jgi:hypothetical protein